MFKKVLKAFVVFTLMFSIVGCSKESSGSSSKNTKVNIKTPADFKESDGLVNYFTIEDHKFSIPKTVGEYENYLKQIGTVTLGDTGNSSFDETMKANSISSMVAYLNVETDEGDEHHFIVRYENTSNKEISIAEAKITYLELRYDSLSEQDYEKTFDSIVVYVNHKEVPIFDKTKMEDIGDACGKLPEQNTDGRIQYTDDKGYVYIFDCSTELRNGIFRGLIIKYPSK